ncbi:aminotransferase class I/II-fold pyridoxal phosphate-dependent enzyme [Streptomyces venezuelae]|uniref:MocR-like pyridoxine biosynthesis transcription factor PdxR n=1 Tax=Streptomyces venezuelae TaxID=54571 RepID=UPI00123B27FA|nr:PLP-dependent aminotransferase family protein [Streptomyces venezuelae]QES07940.1 aminotransferase class I/II-fold pyridoxal phosphate-dependent enzyme [Streptomyces venezuelae]
MANEWATFGADLHLELRGTRLRAGLMDALREAVRSGRLEAGTRLPSSRSLATDLGMARNTVADAYAELVAEGWLTARQGSGTRVARRAEPRDEPRRAGAGRTGAGRTGAGRTGAGPTGAGRTEAGRAGAGRTGAGRAGPPPASARPASADPPTLSLPRPARPAHNLKAGTPDLASFPRAEWLKAYRRALTAAPNEAFGYGDPRGRIELRTVLAEYLARARGVYVRPERIVVCAGFVHGLMLMGQVLRSRGVRDVAVESYGLGLHAGLLTGAGLGIPVLPFDERGTRVEELAEGGAGPLGSAGAVLMTAAHQFPLGGALPPDRRAAVVDWARATGGFVLEDDYDGEFRYDRQPVGALQGLDPERVVYLGTASKSLAPGLRLAWMVLPESLVDEVAAAKGAVDWVSSAPDQLAFAEFLASGAYDRHVRAMRLRYRRRRDQLVAAVAEHSPETRVSGIAAGLHAVLALPPGTEQATLRAAAWNGLAVQGVNQFRRPTVPETLDGLVVGYATPPDSAWHSALEALRRILP